MNQSKIKVLLVDDDVLLGNGVVQELNKRGYEATYLSASYGVADAIKQLSPNILVFDVKIGKENGIEMTKELFNGSPTLPVIFISSHHEDKIKISGLHAGGLAYLDKPFSVKLLSAHIDRFTRKNNLTPEASKHIINFGKTQLDTCNRTIILSNEKIIDLRPMEYAILEVLVENFNEIVSRNDIYSAIWGKDIAFYNEQSLNNYIRRVRVVMEKNNTGVEISMHRGLGYKLRDSEFTQI